MADWDIVVIGGGAAGLSAAAEAANGGRSCLVVDPMGGGGELMNLGPLHDFGEALTGPDLAARLLEEAIVAGAELGIAEVTGLAPEATGWRIETGDDLHTARAVVLAVGLAPGTLGLDHERQFEGQGLSHCAACDGPLYRGQPVAVAGADRWAQREAGELAAMASHVILVSQGLVSQGAAAPTLTEGITVIHGRITALEGSAGLECITIQPADGGAAQRLRASAVFVQTGRRPALGFVPFALARDPDGRLVTDEAMRCSLPGLFAAGDARAGSPRTLAAAVAEGHRAAAAAHTMLDRTE